LYFKSNKYDKVYWTLLFHKRHLKKKCLLKAYKALYISNVRLLTRLFTCETIVQTRVQREGSSTLFKALKLWYYNKVHWTLLFHKMHFKGRCLLKAYKAYNTVIPSAFIISLFIIFYCILKVINMIKSIEPYSSTKCTLWEKVCSRLKKPTIQLYFGNVGLLTRPLTCALLSKHVYYRREDLTLFNALKLWYYNKVYWILLFCKMHFREDVCSRLIKPIIHLYLGNVGLLTKYWYDKILNNLILK